MEAAKTAVMAADATYQSLKGQRHQLFMDCFDTVASVIDGVYKEFTTSAQHPMGGTATLTLLNDADPFDPEGACAPLPPRPRLSVRRDALPPCRRRLALPTRAHSPIALCVSCS